MIGQDYEIVERLKQTNKDRDGISAWQNWFTNTSKTFQEETESAFAGINKNVGDIISKAYGEYQKNSISLKKNPYLLSGFKDKYSNLSSDSSFTNIVDDTRLQGEQAKQQVAYENSMNFQKQQQQVESDLYKKAGSFQKLHKLLIEFTGKSQDELIKEGYYVVKNGGTTLTDKGRRMYDEYLNVGRDSGDNKQQFSEFVSQHDDDLGNTYLNDYDDFKQVIAGLEPGDISFDLEKEYPVQYYKEKYNIDINKPMTADDVIATLPKLLGGINKTLARDLVINLKDYEAFEHPNTGDSYMRIGDNYFLVPKKDKKK